MSEQTDRCPECGKILPHLARRSPVSPPEDVAALIAECEQFVRVSRAKGYADAADGLIERLIAALGAPVPVDPPEVANAIEAVQRLAQFVIDEMPDDSHEAVYEDLDAVERVLRAVRAPVPVETVTLERPEIVVLCGSTRFYDEFQQANYDLTMQGKIVLSVGFYPHAKAQHGHGEGVGHDSAEKVALDELHKRKIDLADRVLVLNVGGYVGESTRSEIEYAERIGRPVDYLFRPTREEGQ